MDRRDFLADAARYAAFCAIVPNVWRVTGRPRLAADPFTLGVASGDPTPTGGVLWTRLAPRPLDPDGGMEGLRTIVTWEIAADDSFTKILKQGRATAAPELSYSIHVDVNGLEPDRWYFYRFSAGDARSPVGHFRTTPAAPATTPLSFAFVSCQHYEQGYYTAYEHLAREELDLVSHLATTSMITARTSRRRGNTRRQRSARSTHTARAMRNTKATRRSRPRTPSVPGS